MSDDENELSLNAHIRNLLQEYALTHLTVDHVQFSESLVSDILPAILNSIPTHEPGLIFRPSDPFEALKTKWNLGSLPAYDEVWQPSSEALELLKSTLLPSKRRLKSETVWEEEDSFDFEKMPHRPLTPLLSRESKRKTPVIGKSPKHMSLSATLSLHGIEQAREESVPDRGLLNLDDYMDVKLTIDASMHAELVDSQKGIPFLLCPISRVFSRHAIDFLRSQSPKYEELLRPMSPPLFCREQQAHIAGRDVNNNLLGPLKFAPVDVEEVESDIANENMVLVDGWVTIASSASTPSLSSGCSEVDELEEDGVEIWRPLSSDGAPVAIEAFEMSKMEDPIFSRAERPRNGKAKVERDEDKSLSKFLTSRLSPNISINPNTVSISDDDGIRRTRSSPPLMSIVSLSMLGQPPSDSDVPTKSFNESESVEENPNKDIWRVLGGHLNSNVLGALKDIIMHERLDESGSMFMDVPILSPPNEYFKNAARVIEEGIAPKNSKKVSGLKSLNIELSWRPFAFGAKIPTHAELVGVDSLFTTDKYLTGGHESSIDQAAVMELLKNLSILHDNRSSADASNSHDLPSEHAELDFRYTKDHLADTEPRCFSSRFNPNRDFDDVQPLLLARSERRALAFNQQSGNFDVDTFNKLPDHDNFTIYETSDYSSAITPDFEPHLSAVHAAKDNDEFTNIYNHITSHATSQGQFEGDFLAYPDECELDDLRDWKKRRLSYTELDALCSANIGLQSVKLTVNPKELVLPRESESLYGNQLGRDGTIIEPPQFSQSSFCPSQSIPLSLHEDDSLFQEPLPPNGTLGIEENVASNTEPMAHFVAEFNPTNTRPNSPSELQSNDIVIKSTNRKIVRVPKIPTHGYSAISHQQQRPITHLDEYYSHKLSPSLPLLCDDYSLSRFIGLRRKGYGSSTESDIKPRPDVSTTPTITNEDSSHFQVYYSAPPDLLVDTRALMIPDSWQLPTTEHSYFVSIDFIQQRALTRIMESPTCLVRLVHRDNINPTPPSCIPAISNVQYSADISIITSPHSGVVFFSLAALPSQTAYKTLLDALAAHSWRFSHVLLVLMAFPRSDLIRATNIDLGERNRLDRPCSYSPPVLKAVRRIKRDLGLREGTGEKRAGSIVELSFADDIKQAAILVRTFADLTLRDSVVDYTLYLTEDEQEGEVDLAEVEGMNIFCSALILRCCTLGEFLEMAPEMRTEGLADLIGQERIEHVNAILSKRMQMIGMDLPSSSETLSSLNG